MVGRNADVSKCRRKNRRRPWIVTVPMRSQDDCAHGKYFRTRCDAIPYLRSRRRPARRPRAGTRNANRRRNTCGADCTIQDLRCVLAVETAASTNEAQIQSRHSGGDIETDLPLHRQRLQRDGAVGPADQGVGARADDDGGVGAAADIGAG